MTAIRASSSRCQGIVRVAVRCGFLSLGVCCIICFLGTLRLTSRSWVSWERTSAWVPWLCLWNAPTSCFGIQGTGRAVSCSLPGVVVTGVPSALLVQDSSGLSVCGPHLVLLLDVHLLWLSRSISWTRGITYAGINTMDAVFPSRASAMPSTSISTTASSCARTSLSLSSPNCEA